MTNSGDNAFGTCANVLKRAHKASSADYNPIIINQRIHHSQQLLHAVISALRRRNLSPNTSHRHPSLRHSLTCFLYFHNLSYVFLFTVTNYHCRIFIFVEISTKDFFMKIHVLKTSTSLKNIVVFLIHDLASVLNHFANFLEFLLAT